MVGISSRGLGELNRTMSEVVVDGVTYIVPKDVAGAIVTICSEVLGIRQEGKIALYAVGVGRAPIREIKHIRSITGWNLKRCKVVVDRIREKRQRTAIGYFPWEKIEEMIREAKKASLTLGHDSPLSLLAKEAE